jgi:hypothetical protein
VVLPVLLSIGYGAMELPACRLGKPLGLTEKQMALQAHAPGVLHFAHGSVAVGSTTHLLSSQKQLAAAGIRKKAQGTGVALPRTAGAKLVRANHTTRSCTNGIDVPRGPTPSRGAPPSVSLELVTTGKR